MVGHGITDACRRLPCVFAASVYSVPSTDIENDISAGQAVLLNENSLLQQDLGHVGAASPGSGLRQRQAGANKLHTMIKNGVEVKCSGDPYCEAQPFVECCPQGPDAELRPHLPGKVRILFASHS